MHFESAAKPCPPVIVGIGLGGTSNVAMALAKEASTFREIGSASPDPEVARLEQELLDKVNRTGIGPQGLGGATTALAVHIEWAHTHITQNPVFGIRDATQIRIFDEGVPPPVDLAGSVCLHTAPGVRKLANGKYEKTSIGTTTSTRMDRFVPGLVETYGVRAIAGKGGLLGGSVEAMRKFGAVYLAVVGGAAALETMQIEEIEGVWWEDLMPEWPVEVPRPRFRPLDRGHRFPRQQPV